MDMLLEDVIPAKAIPNWILQSSLWKNLGIPEHVLE